MHGASWAQFNSAADSTRKRILLKLMTGLENYGEFADLVELALTYSISELVAAKNIVNPVGENKSRLDEDQLTFSLIQTLKGMMFDISHGQNQGGSTDILVTGPHESIWIGEAKIYTDYGKLMKGFQQLSNRYASGLEGQTRGGMLVYFFDDKVKTKMEAWKAYLLEARDGLSIEIVEGQPLQFRSHEAHVATEAMLNTLHMAVPLMHNPLDALPPPKRTIG